MLIKRDILSSELSPKGEIRIKLGNSNAQSAAAPQNVPVYGIDGFYSKPNKPDAKGSAFCLYDPSGSGRVVASKDNRLTEFYGQMDDGDKAIITRNGSRVFIKDDGRSVSITVKTDDGLDLVAQLNGKKKTWSVVVGDGADSSWFTQAPAKIYMGVSGGGALKIDKKGVTINGEKFEANVGKVFLAMAEPSGTAPLIDGVNACCVGPSGMTAAPSTKVLCGI
ncbi:MAG: hypothetical protein HOW73_47515 [Polyangiaceae bacterium]|nr:hypothetical protein [Polyangiaceae bacterium]